MDEALKHAAEHSDLAAVKAWLTLFDQLMQAERIPGDTRRRVLNRCLFGDPRGDVFAKVSLDVEAAVAAMDPETLGFRIGEWITSAEEAGWGPVPEKVTVDLPATTSRCDVLMPDARSLRAGDPLMVDDKVYRVSQVLVDDNTEFRAQVRPDTEETDRG